MSNSDQQAWQQEETDLPQRRQMIQTVYNLLQQRQQESPALLRQHCHDRPTSEAAVLELAKKLELSLYKQAPSMQEYQDHQTLQLRIQNIAIEVVRANSGITHKINRPNNNP